MSSLPRAPQPIIGPPPHIEPSHQPHANLYCWMCGGIVLCIALLITSFVLAHGKVDLIVPAFLYSVRLLAWWFQAGRPLNDETIAIPITTAVIAVVTLSAMRFGYKAGFKPGIKQTRGKLIVPPSQLYVVAYGKHNAGINIAGAPLTKRDETNGVMIVAGSGGGKTVIILDIIRQVWQRGERALILDAKPEFLSVIPEPQPGDERRVVSLAYWSSDSAIWATGRDIVDEATAARFSTSIASSISTELLKGGSFWVEGAEILTRTATLACMADGPDWTLCDFYRTLDALLRLSFQDIRSIIRRFFPLGEAIISENAEEMTAGFLANVTTALKPIDLLSKWETALGPNAPRYSVTDFYDGRDFLVVSSACVNKTAGRVFANTFLDMALERLLARPNAASPADAEAATWFVLDEIGDAGRLDALESGIVKLRSKGGRTVIGFQSIAQIAKTYDRQTAQIWRSSLKTLILAEQRGGGQDGDENWASDQVGEAEFELYELATTPGGYGQYIKRPMALVPPATFTRLGLVTDRLGRELGVRVIGVVNNRVSELWQPIVQYKEFRSVMTPIILKTPAPITGRISSGVQAAVRKATQAALAEQPKREQ